MRHCTHLLLQHAFVCVFQVEMPAIIMHSNYLGLAGHDKCTQATVCVHAVSHLVPPISAKSTNPSFSVAELQKKLYTILEKQNAATALSPLFFDCHGAP